MITWLAGDAPFPPIERALTEPNGLLAAGGDLSPERLLAAYRRGIFPWYSAGQPILWWTPDPRMVLDVASFKVARSLRKTVRQRRFEIRADTSFTRVIHACATTPRSGQFGTWITPQMVDAYTELHRRGYAHSVEAWKGDELVGGLYGLLLDRVFFGESMFAFETDASKVALVALVSVLRTIGVEMVDCQQETEHLATFGARPIARAEFAAKLGRLINSFHPSTTWPRGPIVDPA
jgi:leucyl/phenylalanyl-tRNA--protein transferase